MSIYKAPKPYYPKANCPPLTHSLYVNILQKSHIQKFLMKVLHTVPYPFVLISCGVINVSFLGRGDNHGYITAYQRDSITIAQHTWKMAIQRCREVPISKLRLIIKEKEPVRVLALTIMSLSQTSYCASSSGNIVKLTFQDFQPRNNG